MAEKSYLDKLFRESKVDGLDEFIEKRLPQSGLLKQFNESIANKNYKDACDEALNIINNGNKTLGQRLFKQAFADLIENHKSSDSELFYIEYTFLECIGYGYDPKNPTIPIDSELPNTALRILVDDNIRRGEIREALNCLVRLVENGESQYRPMIDETIEKYPSDVDNTQVLDNISIAKQYEHGKELLADGDFRGFTLINQGLSYKLEYSLEYATRNPSKDLKFVEDVLANMRSWGFEPDLSLLSLYETIKNGTPATLEQIRLYRIAIKKGDYDTAREIVRSEDFGDPQSRDRLLFSAYEKQIKEIFEKIRNEREDKLKSSDYSNLSIEFNIAQSLVVGAEADGLNDWRVLANQFLRERADYFRASGDAYWELKDLIDHVEGGHPESLPRINEIIAQVGADGIAKNIKDEDVCTETDALNLIARGDSRGLVFLEKILSEKITECIDRNNVEFTLWTQRLVERFKNWGFELSPDQQAEYELLLTLNSYNQCLKQNDFHKAIVYALDIKEDNLEKGMDLFWQASKKLIEYVNDCFETEANIKDRNFIFNLLTQLVYDYGDDSDFQIDPVLRESAENALARFR